MGRIARTVAAVWESVPAGAVWLIGSAVFFLIGAHGFSGLGAQTLSRIGMFGASGALAVALAFCDWRRPKIHPLR